MEKSKPLIILLIISVIIIFASIFVIFKYYPTLKKKNYGVVRVGQEAKIGGDFVLVDPEGNTVDSQKFRGKIMLVYFGFTFCPDICPATLHVMSEILAALDKDADKVQGVFITVDPERDTKENLGSYLKHFHNNMIALTGNKEEIDKVAKKYKLYYAKTKEAKDDDYMINHSSFIYVMGKDGKYITNFTHHMSLEAMVEEIKKHI
jgi:protein SCO1/2